MLGGGARAAPATSPSCGPATTRRTRARVENLAELHAVASEFEQSDPEGYLADFLERVSLVADTDQIPDEDVADGAAQSARPDQGVVTLMTLHTAKGLEFPVVFLTGMEDGTFPHMRSLHDVSSSPRSAGWPTWATRARRAAVHLAGVGARGLGMPNEFPESRFLQELPEELLDWRRRESSTAASARRAGARATGPAAAELVRASWRHAREA